VTPQVPVASLGSGSAPSPLLRDELAHCLKKFLPCKWLSQSRNVVEQPVGIRHRITYMQDWQSRPVAAD
jgi:hypothetical protein